MAYSWNRMLIFGGAGIAIAALIIIFFIPVKTEIHMDPLVSLQEIQGYGFQIVKISEEQTDMIHLNLTLGGFEVKGVDGKWTKIDIETVSLNLIRDPGTSITVDAGRLDPGRYIAVRFQVLGGLEYTNATLTNGEVVPVDVPSFKVEVATGEFEVGEGREGFVLVLRRGSGQLVNHMLPDYHISIRTMRVEVAPAGGFGIYLSESGELVISDLEIISYNRTSHEIRLTDAGVEKIEGLQVPMNGTGFVIKVEGEEIYHGAFWSPISSISYHGVVIETLMTNNSIKIEAGYPPSQFQGEDPRNNPKVFGYLERIGKLTD